MKNKLISFLLIITCALSCQKNEQLHTVSVQEFSEFINETGYITDAEKFGWSFIQKTVYDYEIVKNISWKNPSGKGEAKPDFPVTQVSYNDVVAYCKWANKKLPNYNDYWRLANKDKKPLNFNTIQMYEANKYNVVGNVWDITTPLDKNKIRLAGGSYLCSENTCNGILPTRELIVDATTSNSHIGFSVIK